MDPAETSPISKPFLFGSREVQSWVDYLPVRWKRNGLRWGGLSVAAVGLALCGAAFLDLCQDTAGNMACVLFPSVAGTLAVAALALILCLVAASFGLAYILRWRISKRQFSQFDVFIKAIKVFSIVGWIVVSAPIGVLMHFMLSDKAGTIFVFVAGAMIIGLAVGIGNATISERTLRKVFRDTRA